MINIGTFFFNPLHASIKVKNNSDVGRKEERMELMTITWLEGSVSHIFHLGPNFHFMKSRKESFKKCQKSYAFFDMK